MKLTLGIFVLIVSTSIPAHASERAVAGMLFKVSMFVNWPSVDRNINLCLTDNSNNLVPIFNNKPLTIQGKSLIVRKVEPNVYKGCHILYLANDDLTFITQSQLADASASILTIGDSTDYLQHGSIAALVSEGDKLRLYINKQNLHSSTIRLQSRLLELAKVVGN